jgi:RNA polymerase sigma-70 factor (ECF subfamily)
MTDERIIELFFARSERGIEELDTKYGATCHRIAQNILGNKEDAEECVNDAYLGVWNSIPPKKPSLLSAFLFKILRNLSITRYHANTAQKRNSFYDIALDELGETISTEESVEKECSQKELTNAIEGFLDTLTRENRVIFVRRYWFSESYTEIAKRTGLTEKNISVRLTRIREKMKEYLSERGILV